MSPNHIKFSIILSLNTSSTPSDTEKQHQTTNSGAAAHCLHLLSVSMSHPPKKISQAQKDYANKVLNNQLPSSPSGKSIKRKQPLPSLPHQSSSSAKTKKTESPNYIKSTSSFTTPTINSAIEISLVSPTKRVTTCVIGSGSKVSDEMSLPATGDIPSDPIISDQDSSNKPNQPALPDMTYETQPKANTSTPACSPTTMATVNTLKARYTSLLSKYRESYESIAKTVAAGNLMEPSPELQARMELTSITGEALEVCCESIFAALDLATQLLQEKDKKIQEMTFQLQSINGGHNHEISSLPQQNSRSFASVVRGSSIRNRPTNTPNGQQRQQLQSSFIPPNQTTEPIKQTKRPTQLVFHTTESTTNQELLKQFQGLANDKALDLNVTARTVRNGILINCKDSSKLPEIKSIAEQLTNAKAVPEPKLYPCVAVLKIPMDVDDSSVTTMLKKFNPILQDLHPKKFEFVVSLPNSRNQEKTMVYRTDKPTLTILLRKRFLQMGVSMYRMQQHIGLNLCSACLRLGSSRSKCACCKRCLEIHPDSDNCTKPQAKKCMKCGGNHIAKDCTAQEPLCFLCVNDPEVTRNNRDTNHRGLSGRCHVRIRQEKQRKKFICDEALEDTLDGSGISTANPTPDADPIGSSSN